MIIVAVTGPGMSEALAQVSNSSRHADAFEFRCDMIRDPDLAVLLRSSKKPCIVTCRPGWEGGQFNGPESERLLFQQEALSSGADYVDIELRAFRQFVSSAHPDLKKVIVSHHADGITRAQVRRLYDRLHRTGAGVIKLAFVARDAWEISHAADFLKSARNDRRNAIAIAMGDAGEASRILYRVLGGWATFAASEDGAASAPGQLTARTMKTLYRADTLSRSTRVFGLIGNPVKHSRGIILHNAVFQRAGVNAVYCNFPVVDLGRFMSAVAPRFHGFSVTVPHKEAMLQYIDNVSPRVNAIGALNTIVRRTSGWFGENTDAAAALDSVERKVPVRGKRVLILGAGGTARALAYECVCRGGVVTIANRTERRARRLAKALGASAIRLDEIRAGEFDVIMNATSIGMWPDVDEDPLREVNLKNTLVFDAISNPPMTALLKHAQRDGATVVSGVEMFLRQAIWQDILYVKKRPDIQFLRRVLHQQMAGE
jgi:3-dehydroquinate dehydratase / shikimate dehydrogenase